MTHIMAGIQLVQTWYEVITPYVNTRSSPAAKRPMTKLLFLAKQHFVLLLVSSKSCQRSTKNRKKYRTRKP